MDIIISVTGHRPQHLGDYPDAEAKIRQFFRDEFARIKPVSVVSGMALGVDQWAAEEALSAGVSLTAALPFKAQARFWSGPAVDKYLDILERAAHIEILYDNPGSKIKAVIALQKRNEWMVNNSGLLLGVWDGTAGGTCNCIRYAKKQKRDMRRLNPRNWQIDTLT